MSDSGSPVSASNAELVHYAARVLAAHAGRCRRNGVAMPLELEALAALLAIGGQRRPGLGLSGVDAKDDRVEALALTYRDVADRLRVSDRTVRRLVAGRVLPAVKIAGQPRVRLADLQAYVDDLDPVGGEDGAAA